MAQVQVLYVATTKGIQQLANPGKSDRWRVVGEALSGQDVVAVAASLTDPQMAYAGSMTGLSQSSDGGASWTTVLDEPITEVVAAPDGAIFAGTAQGRLVRSETGTDWQTVWQGQSSIIEIGVWAADQVAVTLADGTVAIGRGEAWTVAPEFGGARSPVVRSTADTDHFFATTSQVALLPQGARPLDPPPTGALVVLAGSVETVVIATAGPIMRADSGADLVAVEGPTTARILVNPPHFVDFVYAGTASGELWLSKDRGRKWTLLQDGLPPIHDLSFARVL